jgi:hypothetical protein
MTHFLTDGGVRLVQAHETRGLFFQAPRGGTEGEGNGTNVPSGGWEHALRDALHNDGIATVCNIAWFPSGTGDELASATSTFVLVTHLHELRVYTPVRSVRGAPQVRTMKSVQHAGFGCVKS